ncbi:ECF transporter S component [Atribacter laminatus]|uniref:Thiamine transporter HmpT n=1 Tax=Atribacter laminatus TaxID=2847778 RepID=A0A7T1F312_ATRLM|nr:ECF transporter S component [Atribacter laminatus]QPM68235.1 Thiamine precursor transporter HmpT [Atribacter laminatus]
MKITRLIAYTGLSVAVVTVVTMVVQVPIPQTKGYINLGDAVILVFAMLFGAKVGMIGGGLGSALADILTGYAHWAPFTLIIKGIEGLIVGLFASKEMSAGKRIPILILAVLEMVFGYFLVETRLYGLGAALVEIPGNLIQAGSAVIISLLLFYAIKRVEKVYTREV